MPREVKRKKTISGLSITESELRRLIRNELARQHLMNEGLFDSIKNPFKKLGEKAKKLISKKAEEFLSKLKEASKSLKGNDEAKNFFKKLESQEGGQSFKEIISSVPEYSELSKQVSFIKSHNVADLLKSSTVKEGSFDDLNMSLILLEEEYIQKQPQHIISESIIATIAGAWWTATKTVVGVCGMISFACSGAEKIAKYLNFEKLAKFFEKCHHFTENVEEYFLEKVAFPAPVQYAAYRALWAIKHKGEKGEALDFKTFKSDEGKEERDAALKSLKAAVITVLVVEALTHLIHGLVEFFKAAQHSVAETIHAGVHAGTETSNLSKAAASAAEAGESMAAAGKSGVAAKSLSNT